MLEGFSFADLFNSLAVSIQTNLIKYIMLGEKELLSKLVTAPPHYLHGSLSCFPQASAQMSPYETSANLFTRAILSQYTSVLGKVLQRNRTIRVCECVHLQREERRGRRGGEKEGRGEERKAERLILRNYM